MVCVAPVGRSRYSELKCRELCPGTVRGMWSNAFIRNGNVRFIYFKIKIAFDLEQNDDSDAILYFHNNLFFLMKISRRIKIIHELEELKKLFFINLYFVWKKMFGFQHTC